ncbi:hypothetical protein ACUYO6_001864 [Vibrio vulnificus]|uniref:hypothetical protein n=1 Tax=Vibrio vulnificus TaxID=672 RepID=UPI001A257902|nr:hypothetical protein [Vibrio vulnificus]EIO2321774.1 hypothetical protein [Vibrio vulnificus]EIO4067717.1 hypothetical protein [Vibrio vulnificus]EJO9867910.1 hypothetical protein [Vibrio vulnificus]ELH0903738.1 hypothetical protein [Vibrio vulnificus]ELV8667661.1 hypothetical protein [Vibrio vulnificus]
MKTEFSKCFHILSLFFFCYFYIVPAFFVWVYGDMYYVGKEITYNRDIPHVFYGAVCFLAGFLSVTMISPIFKMPARAKSKSHLGVSVLFYFILILFFLYQVYLILDEKRAENLYAIRKGEVAGSHLDFLVSLVIGALQYSLLIILVEKRQTGLALILILSIILTGLMGSIGRTNLLFSIAIFMILIFKSKASNVAVLSLLAMGFMVPIILSLKTIIYYIGTGEGVSVGNIIDGAVFDFDAYFSSFGHVVASYAHAPSLVESIGYRYFFDFVQGPLFYIKLLGLDLGNSITYFNTYNILGVESSIVPPGYLALGYLQLDLLGVFIVGMFWSLLGKLSEFIYLKSGCYSEVNKFVLCFLAANTFYHGDVRIMIMTYFLPVVSLLISTTVFFERDR